MAVKTARSIIAIAEGEDVFIEITAQDGEILNFKTNDINFVIESLQRARERAWERQFQRKAREACALREYVCATCDRAINGGLPLYLDGCWYCEACQRGETR